MDTMGRHPSVILSQLPARARVLILRLRSLGDTVLLTPALAALHKWRPDLRVSVLLEPQFAVILAGNPAVAEVLRLDGSLPTIAAMLKRRYAIAFNQHSGPRSAILTAASGAPVRVCWERRQFRWVYNVEVPDFRHFYGRDHGHAVEHAITQFYWTGLPRGPLPSACVYPQRTALESVAAKLAALGVARDQPYAVLRPGASLATKRWPLERFAELARWLRDTHQLTSIVNLGPGDAEIAAATHEVLSPVAVVVDSLALRELVALIARARLFVGNDSGPTHISSALGRPTVAIFGASNAVNWRPWQPPSRLIRHEAACPHQPAPDEQQDACILCITTEQVADASGTLLAETSQPAPA
jgi:ADP-heptose:LPS heptosyltransferase